MTLKFPLIGIRLQALDICDRLSSFLILLNNLTVSKSLVLTHMVLYYLYQIFVNAIYFLEILSGLQLDFSFWRLDLLLITINQNRQPRLLLIHLRHKICGLTLDLLLEGTRTMRNPNEIIILMAVFGSGFGVKCH